MAFNNVAGALSDPRLAQVAALQAQGMSTAQIMAQLGIPDTPAYATGGFSDSPNAGPYTQAQYQQAAGPGIGDGTLYPGQLPPVAPLYQIPGAPLGPQTPSGTASGSPPPSGSSPPPSAPGTRPPFQFPQFNIPGLNFPFASLPAQANAAFAPQQFSNGSQYGRWNGVNNNAFGLFPNQFQPLFGTNPGGGGMAFQPPYANISGGQIPQLQSPQMPQLPQSQMPQLPSQPQGLLGTQAQQPQTYNMRQIGSQYAPGTTLSMRTGLPAGQSGNGLTPAQSPQQQPLGPGQYATNFFTPGMPQSFTVDQFNQAKQSNPALAYQMATHAGQDYRNAIMQQDGMNNDQFNQWLNNAAYNQGGLNYRFGS